MAFNNKNHYEILEVSVNATTAEIKTAYRKLARKFHPDINKTTEAVTRFKEITTAYETLSNPSTREKYNILNGIFYDEPPKTTTSSNQAQEEYRKNSTQNNNFKHKDEEISKNNNILFLKRELRKCPCPCIM